MKKLSLKSFIFSTAILISYSTFAAASMPVELSSSADADDVLHLAARLHSNERQSLYLEYTERNSTPITQILILAANVDPAIAAEIYEYCVAREDSTKEIIFDIAQLMRKLGPSYKERAKIIKTVGKSLLR